MTFPVELITVPRSRLSSRKLNRLERIINFPFRKVQIFHFAKYRFFISQSTDFPFRFVPFRFAKYNTFFSLRLKFQISTRVSCHDIRLLLYHLSTFILQTSTYLFYKLRCILQFSTYVLCFSTRFYHRYVFVRNGTPYTSMNALK